MNGLTVHPSINSGRTVKPHSLSRLKLVADFIAHVSRLGIPVINQTAEDVQQDMDTLDQWLKGA